MSRRLAVRIPVLPTMVVVALIAAAAGWFGSSRVQSPAEEIRGARSPVPSAISVPVEDVQLVAEVVTRGTVRFDDSFSVPVPASDTVLSVVTATPPLPSQILEEGGVVVEISGRPLIAIAGLLPPYRDLRPGSVGPDVLQLETALVRLGHLEVQPDEEFDQETGDAVEGLYTTLGYAPPPLTAGDEAIRELALLNVAAAEEAAAQAELAVGLAQLPTSVRLELERSVSAASRQLAEGNSQRDIELDSLDTDLDDAKATLAAALASMDSAQDRLAAAQGGAHPDTGLPPTPVELDTLAVALSLAGDDVLAAQAALDSANAALAKTRDDWAHRIAALTTDLEIAQARLDEAVAAQTGPAVMLPLTAARSDLAEAQAELAAVWATTGTGVPARELVAVPSLPRAVLASDMATGDVADGILLTLAGGALLIGSDVAGVDVNTLSIGQEVEIDGDGGVVINGVIAEIATEPGTGTSPPDRYEFLIDPTGQIPPDLLGRNFRVRIPVAATSGRVLVVPIAGLSTSASGHTQVDVIRANGEREVIEVMVGLVARGLAEVTPLSAQLSTTDRVVVGVESQ